MVDSIYTMQSSCGIRLQHGANYFMMKLNQQIVSNGIISLMALNNKEISITINCSNGIKYCFFLQEKTVRIEVIDYVTVLHCRHYPIIGGECIWDNINN